jgi:hypothetical protein
MKFGRRARLLAAGWVLGALVLGSCGKSEDKESTRGGAVDLREIARMAGGVVTLDEEVADIVAMIEAAGFKKKIYEEFPGQEPGTRARVLVYGGEKGTPPGGVIYINKRGINISPAWHWYLTDMVPDSVVNVELNDDGLWDVRMVAGDRVMSFIQEETFTLSGGERTDWIALNGVSSPPVSQSDALWKAFDGDTLTAWRSPLGEGGKAYIELISPFGIKEGILIVRSLNGGPPRRCTLYADGKPVQQFELEAKEATQEIQLDRAIVGAKKVRLEFTSTHGGAQRVEIAELELR